ncbi:MULTISPECIES: ROK family transcriptional regulator [Alteromonadaceae]|uniref:ROK family transcriptional regulator n=1 Tax=Alteromonadaceae TaxID=72275 RepID=UPI001C0839B2|nr:MULTISPECIES: ROK family transcriptional regulator [Aliiglaciecola]MBU2878239.1 ROK family transcriptional regulator [Aliiglaciecola lipolytica]MDO6711850.1 ROK family transcriptional regulator [Aliiglaciecola sp. 2_MG-2023]MDO6752976.1 ROK family transcriptional regulator [Aliiglaciecola sp. 1_MG-2023]
MQTLQQITSISHIEKQLNSSHKKVIENIRRNRKATRAEIAKATGLSNQTLTRLTKHLISLGIVEEHSKIAGQRGQPATYLTLIPGVFASVGVVFEHDRVVVLLDDLDRTNIVRFCKDGTFLSAELAIKAALSMLDQLFSELDPSINILGIGISISGFFTNEEGRICSQQDPQGWSVVNFQETFAKRYKQHCFVENDGNAASIGFSLTKKGATLQSFYLMLFTLDIGGGFVFEGEVVDGAFGNAGEISTLFSSDKSQLRPNLGSLYKHLSAVWGEEATPEKIQAAIANQDTNIKSWVTACVETMKFPLKAIQSLLDPEAIVFTGRLPIELQKSLSEKVVVTGASYGDVFAPTPKIHIADGNDILEKGVTAIPAFYFFKR